MSKNVLLKLQDDVFKETEQLTSKLKTSRNAYLNAAVSFYNQLKKRALLKKEFEKESRLVRENSMEVLEIFEKLEDEI